MVIPAICAVLEFCHLSCKTGRNRIGIRFTQRPAVAPVVLVTNIQGAIVRYACSAGSPDSV